MVDLTLLDDSIETRESGSHDGDQLLQVLVGGEVKDESPNLSEIERVACFLVAKGHSYEEAGSLLGVSSGIVEGWRTSRAMFRLVLSIQSSLKLTVREQIQRFAPTALQRKMELVMFSKNENVVNAASSFILEQAEGKATQKVELRSLNFNAQMEASEIDSALEAAQTRLLKLEQERAAVAAAKRLN